MYIKKFNYLILWLAILLTGCAAPSTPYRSPPNATATLIIENNTTGNTTGGAYDDANECSGPHGFYDQNDHLISATSQKRIEVKIPSDQPFAFIITSTFEASSVREFLFCNIVPTFKPIANKKYIASVHRSDKYCYADISVAEQGAAEGSAKSGVPVVFRKWMAPNLFSPKSCALMLPDEARILQ
jgi:hypothetical protein